LIRAEVKQTWTKEGNRTKEETTAMFGITSETLRQFSLNEILLLIAMNIETSRLAAEKRARLATSTALNS
jgi:hypothetical protein